MTEQHTNLVETPTNQPVRVFNPITAEFESALDLVIIRWPDIISDSLISRLEDIEPTRPVILALNLYDIGQTIINALHQLVERRPGCFITVFGTRRT